MTSSYCLAEASRRKFSRFLMNVVGCQMAGLVQLLQQESLWSDPATDRDALRRHAERRL